MVFLSVLIMKFIDGKFVVCRCILLFEYKDFGCIVFDEKIDVGE